MKSGWVFNKFHHLDEIIHHVISDDIKAYGIHHLFSFSQLIWFAMLSITGFIFLACTYGCLWIHYKRTRGININQMYLMEVFDMVLDRP